ILRDGLVAGPPASWRIICAFRSYGGPAAGRACCARQQFQEQKLLPKPPVAQEFDVTVHLIDGMEIELGEISGDADEPGAGPLDRFGLLCTYPLQHQPFKIATMVHQPVEIEQALVNDVLVARPLVLDDDGRTILINTQGVHATTV